MNTKLLETKSMEDQIYSLISNIDPYDELECQQIQETKSWINSGAQIFRIAKPDIPNKHLVSYFILFDEQARKILLVDHKKAQLWLPSGGHVELEEHPFEAARRECVEELQIEPEFYFSDPIFLTSTITVGLTAGHTDVSLWYVIKGNSQDQYIYDADEFSSIKWFDLNEIPFAQSDPHMRRFVSKLKALLSFS